jgi:hypothetical protein
MSLIVAAPWHLDASLNRRLGHGGGCRGGKSRAMKLATLEPIATTGEADLLGNANRLQQKFHRLVAMQTNGSHGSVTSLTEVLRSRPRPCTTEQGEQGDHMSGSHNRVRAPG